MRNGVNHARPAGRMPLTLKSVGFAVLTIMLQLATQYVRKVASALVQSRLSQRSTSNTEAGRALINSDGWVLVGEATARDDEHESLDGGRIDFPVSEPSKYRTALYTARTMYARAGRSEPACAVSPLRTRGECARGAETRPDTLGAIALGIESAPAEHQQIEHVVNQRRRPEVLQCIKRRATGFVERYDFAKPLEQ